MTDATGAARFNSGKPLVSLVPGSLVTYTAYGLTYGAIKYDFDNWRKGFDWRSILNSLERHLMAFKDGEDYDEESGLPHLALMGCNLAFLIEHFDKNLGRDDRFKYANPRPGKVLTFKEPLRKLADEGRAA
jgi:hypothetical protein